MESADTNIKIQYAYESVKLPDEDNFSLEERSVFRTPFDFWTDFSLLYCSSHADAVVWPLIWM